MNLLSLPEEILLNILSSLSGPDLLVFASVNRYTNSFYKSSSRLQYIAELDLAGCLDESLDTHEGAESLVKESGNDSDVASDRAPNSSEKLAYLRKREHNWRMLDLTRNAKRTPLEQEMEVSVYDLSGGVFGFAEFGRESMLRYVELREVSRREGVQDDEDEVAQENDDDIASVSTGDTNDNENETPKLPRTDVPWKTFPFEGNTADFGLALKEHDLIVSVSYDAKSWQGRLRLPSMQVIKLHLYQFSTQSPHPSAKEPHILLAEKPAVYARPSPIIEVSGEYIVVLLTFPRAMIREALVEDVFIINWQTGRIVYHQSYHVPTYHAVAFVTPSLLVLPNLVENALDLLHICSAYELETPESNNTTHAILLSRLRLPEMTGNFKLRGVVCRGDPNPTSSTPDPLADHTYNPMMANESSGPLARTRAWGAAGYGVTADPLRAIVSFKFIIVHADAAIPYGPALNLVVHRSALAELAQPALDKHRGGLDLATTILGVSEVPWKEWGPKVTRWRLEDDYVEWVTTTAGQRQVFTSLAPDSDGRWWNSVVVVRDFNPFEVRRMKAKATQQRAAERDIVEGKGKGKAAEGQNHAGEENEIRIHVDSMDGEREDDSEDEDELGLGVNADAAPGTADLVHAAALIPGPLPVMPENETEHDLVVMEGSEAEDENQASSTTSRYVSGDLGGPEPEPSSIASSLPPSSASPDSGSSLSSLGVPLPLSELRTSIGTQTPAPSVSASTLPGPPNSNHSINGPEQPATLPTPPEETHDLPQTNPVSSNPPLKPIFIRIRDTKSTMKVRYYRSGDLTGGLPCVEYVLEGCEGLFSGVLMDEERIIGYLEDAENPDQIERMTQVCVFSMYP